MKDFDDNILLAKIKNGDSAAFKHIVGKYESKVATVIRNMLGNTSEVDDVGQEVFIRLYKSLDKYRGEAALGTYITRIAMNLSLNEIKKRKRKRWIPFTRKDSADAWDIEDKSADLSRLDDKDLVQRAILRLKENYRAIIVLRMIEGYSVKETAELLKIPQGTVLSRQSRATEQLKQILENKMSYRHGE